MLVSIGFPTCKPVFNSVFNMVRVPLAVTIGPSRRTGESQYPEWSVIMSDTFPETSHKIGPKSSLVPFVLLLVICHAERCLT